MILIITGILSKNAIVVSVIIFLTVTRIKIISIKETEALRCTTIHMTHNIIHPLSYNRSPTMAHDTRRGVKREKVDLKLTPQRS